MRLSRFFIDRPIFAAALSIVIFIAGAISIFTLPISEYPEVVPPSIVVHAVYPGANPRVLAEAVAGPLEEQINGVENMLYLSSQATSDGVLTLTVTFRVGTDPDLAQVQVQNRVSQALPRLPEEVRQLGVTTVKSSPNITMVVHLVSPDNRYDMVYLRNYAVLQVKDVLARIPGVGQVVIFGAGDYAIRVWLDPNKVAARGLSASDIVGAIRDQNVQVAAGVVGGMPMNQPVDFTLTVNARGRLTSEDEFRDIVVKTGADGQITRLGDVARVELASGSYSLRSMLDNKDAVAMGIFQAPGSNALRVSSTVRETMDQLSRNFPQGVEYQVVYDPTTNVREGIAEVAKTLFEAIVLVVFVVVLFLQTWRASIIPLVAVPVSIVGTFAVLLAFGFSINTLSLFGLVLSIGIVVDDAIVVVENVERNIAAGLSPREASYKAMQEVSRPIIAIALVLCAVFIPVAFVSGLTGQFYRQFALTIAFSTVISAINSLTLSPALSAILLRRHDVAPDRLTRLLNFLFGWLFRRFNRLFARGSEGYGRAAGRVIRRRGVALAVYAGLLAVTAFAFSRLPSGFVPTQDKRYLVAFAQLPDAATLDRTTAVVRKMAEIGLKQPGVSGAVQFPGLSINGFVNASNAGIIFFALTPFEERRSKELYGPAIAGALNRKFASIQDAFVAVFPPPPVMGLGTVGGFKMEIEDRAGMGEAELAKATQALVARAYQTPELAGLFSSYRIDVPQLDVDVDREKVKQAGLSLTEVFRTMQIYLGSVYVNDFNRFGRTYQVIVQADAPFRSNSESIAQLKVRNAEGGMVPLGSMLRVKASRGPDQQLHYNAYPAADINGGPAPGVSSGQAVEVMERLARETLPNGIGFEWTDLTYQQRLAGNTTGFIFILCVLLVFLVLAAQYESWSLPAAVILIVPLSLLCAAAGIWLTDGDNNVFTQVGFLVLIGLACKNAILIVEFARELEHQGRAPVAAALEAARIRLRPILMTSFAFIMGVIPLVVSTGAGAEIRRAMGVAVFAGMLGVTFFGLVLTPVFYVLVRGVGLRGARVPQPQPTPGATTVLVET
ncbi:MAG TPA: multidrug efflux RND transporter permease subunit [Polyangia bacterium]|nr:multidrug efflux RND transporter permease subunit [Polyangia bacterium]